MLNSGGGGGEPHMKRSGMFAVSLRGVNQGLWSHLGCSRRNATILAVKVSLRVVREEITKQKEF